MKSRIYAAPVLKGLSMLNWHGSDVWCDGHNIAELEIKKYRSSEMIIKS